MHPDESPGPDGSNPAFYKFFWHFCGDDIYKTANDWLDRDFSSSSLDDTNICLIPKCANPYTTKKLRLILLCNVAYKLVSKVIANRLKQRLTKGVSKEQ